MKKKGRSVTFRPSAETRKWLEIAQEAGLDMSQIINTILDGQIQTQVRGQVEERAKQLAFLVQKAA